MENLILIIALIIGNGLGSAAVSFTITWSGIFEGFREWIASRSKFLEELIFCPWCTNFYVLILFMSCELINWHEVLFKIDLFTCLICWFLALFISWTIAGICHYILLRAYEPVKDFMLDRAIRKMEKE